MILQSFREGHTDDVTKCGVRTGCFFVPENVTSAELLLGVGRG